MRVYLKVTGEELTGVTAISPVVVQSGTGSQVEIWLYNKYFANLATHTGYLLQKIEIRKNDGSTVIWTGVVDDLDVNDLRGTKLICVSPLRLTEDITCYYNAELGEGLVTAISDPVITDDNNTFVSASVNGKWVSFTDAGGVSTELDYPNSSTDFFGAPASSAGTYEDLDDAGSSCMSLTDSGGDTDEFGIDLFFTVANEDSSSRIVITIDFECHVRSLYAQDGSNTPLIEIWDNITNGGEWKTTGDGGIAGIGRLTAAYYYKAGGRYQAEFRRRIIITSSITNYFDASHICNVRVTAGKTTISSYHKLKIYYATCENTYTSQFTNTAAYEIDSSTTTTLTVTGDTPQADGVAVGDTFKIGDLLHLIIPEIWRKARITFTDYAWDTSSLVDCSNLLGSSVFMILTRYARADGVQLWDNVSDWSIKGSASFAASGLTLTEDNFQRGSVSIRYRGSDSAGTAITSAMNTFYQLFPADESLNKGFLTYKDSDMVDLLTPTGSMAQALGTALMVEYADLYLELTGTINTDDGNDYSALALNSTLDIALFTDRLTITTGRITRIEWRQARGDHLYATITVRSNV